MNADDTGSATELEPAPARESSDRGLLPALSLPKGGGAIRGIGEKFSTNPATGTGSLSVPIATSPGRGGFDLTLELSYDSGAGNGPFGIGWQLSTPAITRKTDKGLPRYADGEDSDTFVLSGAEDLVPVPTPTGAGDDDHEVQRYRPRVEGLFARIERWTRSDGDVHWRATTRDNVVNIYGRSESARTTDPKAPQTGRKARVFSWLLEETRDDRGNVARYRYKREDGSHVEPRLSERSRFRVDEDGRPMFEATAQLYVERIQYGNVEPVARHAPAPEDDDAWLFEVVFDYGEYAAPPENEPHATVAPAPGAPGKWPVRHDPFSSYRSGFEVRTYRLCRRALMFHRFPAGTRGLDVSPCLVRSTDFAYDSGPVVTYLKSVTQAGYRWSATHYERATLPSLELGYAKPPAELDDQLHAFDPESLEGTPSGLDGSFHQWVDLDGEGIPGILTAHPRSWHYKPNLGGGRLAPPVELHALPSPADIGAGAQLSDLAGDGQLDLVDYSPPLPGYFTRTQTGDWQPFASFDALPNIDWNDPNLRFIELDGDGHPDVLITEQNAFVWYRSRAKEGFEPAAVVTKPRDETQGPAVVFEDGTETIFLADMSGDGLADLARVRNGEVCYWPNLGYGRFGRKVTLENSPLFDAPEQFDPKLIRFADLDGSGTSDILYLGRDGVAVYLNESGNKLSEPHPIRSLHVDRASRLSVVDLLGRGTSCLVRSSPLPAQRTRPCVYVDPMGGIKPHLLTSIVNNLGAETRIAYAPSTKFYLEDRDAGDFWLTRLPFPVQVVERIERFDHVNASRLVTRFAYHHGYFDGYEREFRGFARVEQWDAESFGAEKGKGLFPEIPYDVDRKDEALNLPPVRTVTWFHTGAWLERERLESELAKEYYGDAPLLKDTVLPRDLTVREQREAARALRGKILRQEIFAEDEKPESDAPYSVSERDYELRLIQHAEGDGHAIFFVHPRETIDLHYERNPDDPRMQHELVLEVDEFGNVTQSARIGYPRREEHRQTEEAATERVLSEQARLWASVSDASFINNKDEESDWYRVGIPAESATWELTGLEAPESGTFTIEQVRAAIRGARELSFEEQPGAGLERRLIEAQCVRYLDDDLQPLPVGKSGSLALQHETYRLALTEGLVAGVLNHDVDAHEVRIDEAWLRDECRYVSGTDIPVDEGYNEVVSEALRNAGWWAPSGHVLYDDVPHARSWFYLPEKARDPFGGVHTVSYDFKLLIREARDPIGNTTKADNDYRVLAPWKLTDPNENQTAVAFDALGMVVETAVMGKGEGDTLNDPTTKLEYDLHRHEPESRGKAAFVKTLLRERHRDPDTPWQISYSYSDGSGREVLRKIQAEPGPVPILDSEGRLERDLDGSPETRRSETRWVVTGRTVFDNKGNPVKKYEPFFWDSPDFNQEKELVEWGVTPVFRYDPLGRLIRTDQPNGTFSKVTFDAWSQSSWDENDTVTESEWYAKRGGTTDPDVLRQKAETRAAWLAAQHAGTPAVAHLDSLGRVFLSVAYNRIERMGSPEDQKLDTRIELDIEGQQRSVTDARGVVVLRQDVDVLGRALHTSSPDAGERWTLPDAGDKPVRSWDGRKHAFRRRYDPLQRPTHVHVSSNGGSEKLTQRTVYGEAPGAPGKNKNVRGQVYRDYDGAGVVTNVQFDFQGNLEESTRRLTKEHDEVADWSRLDSTSMTVDEMAGEADALLLSETFAVQTEYDALNRITSRTTPDGSVTTPTYNPSNFLEKVVVRTRGSSTPTTFIDNIDYNARGQRLLVRYGSDTATETEYVYDDETFRLRRSRTTRGGSTHLQDLAYTYDPVGNITEIADGAQQTIFFDGAVVEPTGRYRYDALYQLIEAEGREHPGQQPTDKETFRSSVPHPNDGQALRRYTERYVYDAVGNIEKMVHDAGPNGWTRLYKYEEESGGMATSNRLEATSVPGDDPDDPYSAKYEHDEHGNMIRMPHLAEMEWDHQDRLIRVDLGGGGTAHYNYNASGERARKVVEKGSVIEERLYFGGYEIFRRRSGTTPELERQTLHVMDDQRRVALIETKTRENDADIPSPISRERFQLDNHLGSSVLELDSDGKVISYEECFPFGGTAYHAARAGVEVSAKRYRYNGKERDEETGLYYYGARYYAAWLGKWTAADPNGLVDGPNRFAYTRNNPILRNDPNGLQSNPPPGFEDIGSISAEAPKSQVLSELNRVLNPEGIQVNDVELSGERWLVREEHVEPVEPIIPPELERALSKAESMATEPPLSPGSTADKATSFAAGAAVGAVTGYGIGYGLGLVAAFNPVGALALGGALLAYGAYSLASNYDRIATGASRLAAGEGTAADYFALGNVVGGFAGGGLGFRGGLSAGRSSSYAAAGNAAKAVPSEWKLAPQLKSIPKDAKVRLLKPDTHGGAQYGVEYQWSNPGGQKVTFRVHGPDATAPVGSNSALGPTYRVKVGSKYSDRFGNLYKRGAANPRSPHYDPSAANATHMPFMPLPYP